MGKYQKIIDLFVSNEPQTWVTETNAWAQKPFIVDSKIYATDGVVLVSFDSQKIKNIDNVYRCDESKLNIFKESFKSNINTTYSLRFLKHCFEKVPLVKCFDEKKKDCAECDGTGEVTYKYKSNYRAYGLDHDCPICEGEGAIIEKIPTGKKEYDKKAHCKIGNDLFFTHIISHIITVCEILGVTEFVHTHQSLPHKANGFKIGDVDLLLMPLMWEGDFDEIEVAFTI